MSDLVRPAQLEASLRIATRVAKLGAWVVDVAAQTVTWSDEIAAIHDEPPGYSPTLEAGIDRYAPEDRDLLRRAVRACTDEGTPFDIELRLVTAKGRRLWVRSIGEAVRQASGEVSHIQGALQDISERKAADDQLKSLAERLRETLESITDAFFTVDREWRFTYLNAAAERILQRTRAELLGRNLWTEFPLAVGTESDREYRRAMREGITVAFEQFYPPLDKWLQVDASPSREGLAVYFRDVTEHRRDREALRLSEERFRLLAGAANDAIWDWNLESDALWWSDGFTSLFGYAPEEIGLTIASWTTRLHAEDRDAVLQAIHACIDGDASAWEHEYRFLRKDGSYAYVVDRGHIIRAADRKAVRMIGGMNDVTERKRAEERLRDQATLLDAATDAIIVRDLEHNILFWNRSAERVYGWTSAEVLGSSIERTLYDDPTRFLAACAATIVNGEWVGELEQRTKDRGTVVAECRWTLVRDAKGEPKSILAINSDITQRKKLEAQFLRAQRMESIGALAGGIAHDLNNALAPILMTVSVLREDETDPSRREDLDTIQMSAQRGADMVRQLLSFARGGADGGRERLDLGRVAHDVAKIMRDTFPKDITWQIGVTPDLWAVSADETQMHQLLTNLCVNARDAMPNGGMLTLAVEHVVLDEVYVGMNLEAKPGPYVLVRVEDTGDGMPAGILDKIFEPFFTTKEVGKGTGLGLSTAHSIVQSHGGFLHVYSEVARGTRFKIYLPADIAAATSAEAAIAQSMLPRGNGELVLVVDDEAPIRNVAQRTLERFGYQVLLASNGAEAVSSYALHRDRIAVVLTDMAMPVMDGPATIVALKVINPSVRIIGSSGLDANGNVAKAVGAGVLHFVPKPYTAEALLQALREILAEP